MSAEQYEGPDQCVRCEGWGWVEILDDDGFPIGPRNCERCDGSGRIPYDAWLAGQGIDPDTGESP